jgi:hypothetical protein
MEIEIVKGKNFCDNGSDLMLVKEARYLDNELRYQLQSLPHIFSFNLIFYSDKLINFPKIIL